MSEGRRRWTSTQRGRASYSFSMGPLSHFFFAVKRAMLCGMRDGYGVL